jgi:DNA-binding NarL/FixJ family response regulator
MDKIAVLIADDHTVFREGLSKLLQGEDDIEVVGQAANGAEAEKLAESLRPQVILMDIDMPEENGVEATARIKSLYPELEVIMLTAFEDDKHLFKSIEAGASGYISKHSQASEITQAIRAASKGESILTPALSRKVLNRFTTLTKKKEEAAGFFSELTKREMQILKLLCQAKSNAQIANEL